MLTNPSASGMVPCPSCQVPMKDWQVFSHLDKCEGPRSSPRKQRRKNTQPVVQPQVLKSSMQSISDRNSAARPDRLPALNYSIIKETVLRKKMQDLGISFAGSKKALEERHREWTTLWNANCDAENPRKLGDLLRELELWERTAGPNANSGFAGSLGGAGAAVVVKDKKFDGAAWSAKHDGSFKDLAEQARQSREKKRQQKGGTLEDGRNERAGEHGMDMNETRGHELRMDDAHPIVLRVDEATNNERLETSHNQVLNSGGPLSSTEILESCKDQSG